MNYEEVKKLVNRLSEAAAAYGRLEYQLTCGAPVEDREAVRKMHAKAIQEMKAAGRTISRELAKGADHE
jgi:hypothetical protein